MAYTFDGTAKLIILSAGTTYVSVKEMYSKWKEWVLIGNNAAFLPAMSAIGADPLPSGQLGSTFFLENGWKIRPQEANHTLSITGNMYSRDGSDPFVNTIGTWNVRIISTVSTLVETVSVGGIGTAAEVANAVWDVAQTSHTTSGSMGAAMGAAGTAGDPWIADLSSYTTPGTAGKIIKDSGLDITTIKNNTDTLETSAAAIAGYVDTLETAVGTLQTTVDNLPESPTASAIAAAVRSELTPELTHILAMENGLTSTQATMLLEIYRMYGLDPTRPLVVTDTNRSAGPEITQTINSGASITTVTRT